MGDGWGNVEAGIQRVFGGVTNPSGSTLAGRETLALGGPEPFARKETLIIESTVPSYWRGQTFDTYTGQGWRSTMRSLEGRKANQPLTESLDLRSRLASRSNIEILGLEFGDSVRAWRRPAAESTVSGTGGGA